MDFVAEYWYLWAMLTFTCVFYCANSQVRRMKSMMNHGLAGDGRGALNAVATGVVPTIVAGALSWLFGLTTLLSLILNIVNYAKK